MYISRRWWAGQLTYGLIPSCDFLLVLIRLNNYRSNGSFKINNDADCYYN